MGEAPASFKLCIILRIRNLFFKDEEEGAEIIEEYLGMGYRGHMCCMNPGYIKPFSKVWKELTSNSSMNTKLSKTALYISFETISMMIFSSTMKSGTMMSIAGFQCLV